MALIRTVLFYLFAVPSTLLMGGIFSLFSFLVPYPKRYYLVIGSWARVMHILTVYVLGIRVKVTGRENIPKDACVIVSNHQSAWETYYLQLVFHPQSQVAKASLLKIPFFGWAFAMLRPIAIDRKNKRKAMTQVIEQGVERIADGSSVLIFPEGTRAKPGKPLRFRRGGAVLAKEAGCLMVPVAHNAGSFWHNDRFILNSGTVDLVIHPPIATDAHSADELMQMAEANITQTLRDLDNPNV